MSYIKKLADCIKSFVPKKDLPGEETNSLFLIYAVLALAKGEYVTAEDVHNAWSAWMTAKDENHESIKEFSELSQETKNQDEPYVQAIHRAVKELKPNSVL